jgi:chemotaxis protein histidine kinase CheA
MQEMYVDEELFAGFFADVEESFYPEVAEAIERIKAGEVGAGVDMMMRPLHTIKGTSAFIGLDGVSEYTHQVEDCLKAVQAGTARPDRDVLVRAVDLVFTLLERARKAPPGAKPDTADAESMLREMAALQQDGAAAKKSDAGGHDQPLVVEHKQGVTFIRVRMPRVHLPGQYTPIVEAIAARESGSSVVLDLAGVRTLNSTTWGAVRHHADRLDLAVVGMGPACNATFYAWQFNRFIPAFSSEEEYWRARAA